MDFSFTLEADGGLNNPVVLAAMAIWLALVLAAAIPLGVYLGRRRALRLPVAWALLLAALLVVPTQFARVAIGTLLYKIHNPEVISVGFWGGYSPVIVPLFAALVWVVAYLYGQDHPAGGASQGQP